MGKCSLFLFPLTWHAITFIYTIVLNHNIVIEKVTYKNDECGFKTIGCVHSKSCEGSINLVLGEMTSLSIPLKNIGSKGNIKRWCFKDNIINSIADLLNIAEEKCQLNEKIPIFSLKMSTFSPSEVLVIVFEAALASAAIKASFSTL